MNSQAITRLLTDRHAIHLLMASPTDGSQDLYVSTMIGIPQTAVPALRQKMRGAHRPPLDGPITPISDRSACPSVPPSRRKDFRYPTK